MWNNAPRSASQLAWLTGLGPSACLRTLGGRFNDEHWVLVKVSQGRRHAAVPREDARRSTSRDRSSHRHVRLKISATADDYTPTDHTVQLTTHRYPSSGRGQERLSTSLEVRLNELT